jgi:hypothetical protein
LTITLSSAASPIDHAQRGLQRPEHEIFLPDRVLRVDHMNELAHLLGADRGIGHQEGVVRQ